MESDLGNWSNGSTSKQHCQCLYQLYFSLAKRRLCHFSSKTALRIWQRALKAAFIEPKTAARFTLKVGNVTDWNGLTLHSELPNHEGYKIRVFCKFSDDCK